MSLKDYIRTYVPSDRQEDALAELGEWIATSTLIKNENARLKAQLEEAEARAERYKAALEFYANPRNWDDGPHSIGGNDSSMTHIEWDTGDKARKALRGDS